ncbi:MAG: Holliday junction branch migration protein RuvA [Patescibacteria group bacterium]|nr:Holliday junction branch migration protein RuvA [Patescibacteria group bacterium]
MIGSLRGKIIYKGLDRVEIDTGGIGWEVFVSRNDLSGIGLNDLVELFIFHHTAENTSSLFGFLIRKDKHVFEMLISVSGVGPKTAIEIFSAGKGERILKAVAEADVDFFQQVKGVGKKGAQRIIIDLKAKVGSARDLDFEREAGANEVVYQALSNLGFRKEEIRQAVNLLPEKIANDDEKIKFILKSIGKNERQNS